MFNIIQDSLNTQESYLGRNMEKAIENEANGRWPIGLESLQNILGRQGNMITVDDMLLLRRNHQALFQRAKKMCHAVRTCQPKSNQIGGGCARQSRPGSQGFNSGGIYSRTPFFSRGAGYAVCMICPAGNTIQKAQTEFRQKTTDIAQIRQNVINTTDLLSFSINRKTGKKYLDINLTTNGHTVKFNKTRHLDIQETLGFFEELAINNPAVDLDVKGNLVVYDSPLISPTNQFTKDFDHDFIKDQTRWKINLVTFSNQRIRYFVGEVSLGQSLQEFTERIPRGVANTQAVRIATDDSLIVWLPSPPGVNKASNDWKERLGPDSHLEAEKISHDGKVQFFLIDKYPGSFMFVKNSKQILEGNKIRKFLNNHIQLINQQSLIPRFYQDTNSLRFLWNSQDNPTTNIDEGGNPEFYLDNKSEFCLLLQLSGHITSEQDEMTESVISYPTVEVGIIEPNDSKSSVQAKLESDEFGFAWSKFKFNQDGIYKIGFRNTQNQRTRWIIVNVESQLSSSDSPTYFGQDGKYHYLDSGKNWGMPPAAEKREMFKSNEKYLFQGISVTDLPFDLQKIKQLNLGHIAEISRLVFHDHAQNIIGSKCIKLSTLQRRINLITYNISNLYGINHNPTNDLTKVLKSLGEFEYWERKPDWESKHYIVPRKTTFAEIDNISELKILFDSRPNNILKDAGINVYNDWNTGLRYVIDSNSISNAHPVILHPKEAQIETSAQSMIVDFWNAAEVFAEPLNIPNDMKEFRLKISGDEANPSNNSAKLPVNRYNINEIAKSLQKGVDCQEWCKKYQWHKASSIEIEGQRRLFISIRVPIKWDYWSSDQIPWKLYLGCLNLNHMSEKVLLIASNPTQDNLSYLDELGNIGTSPQLKMPWLVNPKNSIYDYAYLTRELIRAFASICIGNSQNKSDSLNNVGIPGWIFQSRDPAQQLIHIRANSIMQMANELCDKGEIKLSSIPSHSDLKKDISIAIKKKFWR